MKPLQQLQEILSNEYISADGDKYKVELLSGMTAQEIEELKQSLPQNYLPSDIEELLLFARGFSFNGLEEIRFDALDAFGFEEMFPRSIQLAGDGFGNFWILDLDEKGNWGPVYYVCHDPAVVVKHSDSLTDFIKHVDEFGRLGSTSHLDIIHEKIVNEIWQEKIGLMEKYKKEIEFTEDFMKQLPPFFMIADMTNVPVGTGFPWGRFGAKAKILRYRSAPIWVIEKKVKRGFLEKLFSGKW